MKTISNALLFFFCLFAAFSGGISTKGQEADFNYLYQLTGIRAGIPAEYDAEFVDIAWNSRNYVSRLLSVYAKRSDGTCVVLYPIYVPMIVREGVDDNLAGPLRFISPEIRGALEIGEAKPVRESAAAFWAGDHLTTLEGKLVHDLCQADRLYLYELPRTSAVFSAVKGKRPLPAGLDAYGTYLTRVWIVKEGGYNYHLLLLLTDEGKRNEWKYLSEVLGCISFDFQRMRECWVH